MSMRDDASSDARDVERRQQVHVREARGRRQQVGAAVGTRHVERRELAAIGGRHVGSAMLKSPRAAHTAPVSGASSAFVIESQPAGLRSASSRLTIWL
jgi:hypothetical protein